MLAIERALASLADSERPLLEIFDDAAEVSAVYSYRQTTRAAMALGRYLASLTRSLDRPAVVGVVCGNTAEFVVADLACILSRFIEVPVPLAFSRVQAGNLLAGIDLCLHDRQGATKLVEWGSGALPGGIPTVLLDLSALLHDGEDLPFALPPVAGDWICKTIHTSGTTSHPKGVKIRALGLDALLGSLMAEMPADAFRRYLSTVPMSLLIEQVTGLYMVVLQGGTLSLLPASSPLIGTTPAAGAQTMRFLARAKATALVATPALVEEIERTATALRAAGAAINQTLFGTDDLPLICCGGAPISLEVLRSLDALGIPVYEGYGLSENSSVVAWNRPNARKLGTVGRPLPHVRLMLGDDGEVLVKSTSLFDGYTVDDPSSCAIDDDGWLHTGDLGSVDAEGFLRITGRRKNVIITTTGRNVAPEWVEAQYATLAFVRAVAVAGNHLESLHGLFLVDPAYDLDEARVRIDAFGESHLSDVERVRVAYVLPAKDSDYRRFFTVTGRPMRVILDRAIAEGTIPQPSLSRA